MARRLLGLVVLSLGLIAITPQIATSQIEQFQGVWATKQNALGIIKMNIKGYSVEVFEKCPGEPTKACGYLAKTTAFGPEESADPDARTTLLLVEYVTDKWKRQMLIRSARRERQPLARPTADVVLAVEVLSEPRVDGLPSAGPPSNVFTRLKFKRAAQIIGLAVHRMPQLDWPLPAPTARMTVPDTLVTLGGGKTLGAAFDSLTKALKKVRVDWWSVYAIRYKGAGESGDFEPSYGFAIVTRAEVIEKDGTPKPPEERWASMSEHSPPPIHDFVDLLKAMFTARRGYYRVIIFAVTALPFSASEDTLTAKGAEVLGRHGDLDLSKEMRETLLPPSGRCIASIYEFERPSEEEEPVLLPSSPEDVARHLALAGLWKEEDLRK